MRRHAGNGARQAQVYNGAAIRLNTPAYTNTLSSRIVIANSSFFNNAGVVSTPHHTCLCSTTRTVRHGPSYVERVFFLTLSVCDRVRKVSFHVPLCMCSEWWGPLRAGRDGESADYQLLLSGADWVRMHACISEQPRLAPPFHSLRPWDTHGRFRAAYMTRLSQPCLRPHDSHAWSDPCLLYYVPSLYVAVCL